MTTPRNMRERIYAAHPFGMKPSFFRKWQNDRRASAGSRVSEPPPRGAASGEGNDPGAEAQR